MYWVQVAVGLAGVAGLADCPEVLGVIVEGRTWWELVAFDDVVDFCGSDGAALVAELAYPLVSLEYGGTGSAP